MNEFLAACFLLFGAMNTDRSVHGIAINPITHFTSMKVYNVEFRGSESPEQALAMSLSA